jgi:hypothetical protein
MQILAQYSINKRAIAYILLLILAFPYAVKVFHHHPADCLSAHLPYGLNSEKSYEHHGNCDICSFEYINVLLNEPLKLQYFKVKIRDLFLLPSPTGHSLSACFAFLRAPPLLD